MTDFGVHCIEIWCDCRLKNLKPLMNVEPAGTLSALQRVCGVVSNGVLGGESTSQGVKVKPRDLEDGMWGTAHEGPDPERIEVGKSRLRVCSTATSCSG